MKNLKKATLLCLFIIGGVGATAQGYVLHKKSQAFANTKGWTTITTFDKHQTLKIEASGIWRSNGERFAAAGVAHHDSRHLFPTKNAMAIVFRVRSKYHTEYYTFTIDDLQNTRTYLYIKHIKTAYNGSVVSWAVNDWQAKGLGDNTGHLDLAVYSTNFL